MRLRRFGEIALALLIFYGRSSVRMITLTFCNESLRVSFTAKPQSVEWSIVCALAYGFATTGFPYSGSAWQRLHCHWLGP